MKAALGAIRTYWSDLCQAWDRFWFTPMDPSTLSLIRLAAGAMLFYTHLVWTLDLEAFFGPEGWLPLDLVAEMRAGRPFAWSIFYFIESPWVLWAVHVLALAVFFCLMIGLFSRKMAVLGFLLAVSYAHRITPGAFFGLDKINCMLALYLMLGPCGARYSVDRLWRMRGGRSLQSQPHVSANVAIRMIQLHMCIIYFFSGLGKLQGTPYQGMPWWDGEAVWMSVAIQEYQTIDLTWLAAYPWLYNLFTHVTVFWELSYCFLIWNRFARPWVLFLAVCIHGGIALALGMATFGLVMLIGNMAFLSPRSVQLLADPVAGRVSLALVGSSISPAPVAGHQAGE